MNWLISDKLMQAFCWTLLHSLWQGLLLAIIACVIIMITRRSSPGIRYNLLTTLFILFIATTGFTFMRQISIATKGQPEHVWTEPVTEPISNTSNVGDEAIVSTTAEPDYFENMVQYFNEHASLIVAIWFILFSAKLVRILSNIGYVQRIRNYKTTEPSLYWKQRIIELAQDLRIQRSILLLESAIIKVPMVVGLLKPVILIPIGLLSNLPQGQVEAVLLHELAHIRRKDYLVNLLQSFAETIFFFNPALLWISSLMREERENCCDDIAISRIKNKKQFIHALVTFQEYAMLQSSSSAAIAFAGRKNYLLNRVKRIIDNENKKLNAMEKGFFILSIVAISLIGLMSMRQSSAQKKGSTISTLPAAKPLDAIAVQHTEPYDTIPGTVEFKNFNSVVNKDENGETKTITATDKTGKKYKIVMKNDDPIKLYVDDEKIPAAEMDKYKKLIVAMEQASELRQKKDIEKMKKEQLAQSEKMMKLEAERMQLMQKLNALDEERAKLNLENMKAFKDHEWENAGEINLLTDQMVKLRNEKVQDQLLQKKLLYNHHELLKQKLVDDNILQKQLLNESLENFKSDQLVQNEKNQIFQKQLLNEKMNLLQNYEWEQQHQHTNRLIKPIIEDMVEEKIIAPQQDEISFELNDDRFVVNGKKQPAEVRDRFKKKYLKKKGDYFKFSKKNGNTSTTIHLN